MALYIVGDIQGCFDELMHLLEQVNFCPDKDQLYLCGDLVARGPKSLETLRYIKSLGKSANFVLGNHDLHLLAIHAGLKKNKKLDYLDELLNATDVDELMDWLAQHPLLLELPGKSGYISHAGISPQWTLKQAKENAAFAEKKIAGKKRSYWLEIMYGNQPNDWHAVSTKEERFRFTVNTFTRMRYCYANGLLEFDCKDKPSKAPTSVQPWFELAPVLKKTPWVIGHWAALMGHHNVDSLYALDTGCVWGNHMTMIRWDDKKLFTAKAIKQ